MPDDDLRAAINKAIDSSRAPDTAIFDDEVAGITTVQATSSSNITNLKGLEHLEGLNSLTIYGSFGSLDPIKDLTDIHTLRFFKNNSADLTMIPIESTPRNIELSGAAFTSIDDIVTLGLAPVMSTFYISGTDITTLEGIEKVNFSSNPNDSMLRFGGTASGDRSSLMDLSPIADMANPPRSRIEFSNTLVSDVTPLAELDLRQLYAYNNRIVNISELPDGLRGFDFSSQQIYLGNAALGETATNPLKGYEPGPVSVTSNSSGFEGPDADGNWSFSTPGLKQLEFEFVDSEYTTGSFSTGKWSGTISMTVDGPVLSTGPSEVNPGDTVTVTGEGYLPGEEVEITVDPSGATTTVTADENGSFSTDITIPEDSELGDFTATGVGQESDASASDTFTVVEAPVVPTLTVDPDEVNPGDDATINGSGFLPGEEVVVTIGPDGGTTTVVADEDGSFSVDVTVPEDAEPGTYTATAVGQESERTASDTFEVVEAEVLAPTITVNPDEVNPGGTATVTGEGFLPGEDVVVTITPGAKPVTVTADENGAFSVEITVPKDAALGAQTATAVGQESGASAEGKYSVVAADAGDDDEMVPTGANATMPIVVGALLLTVGAGVIALRNANRRYEV